MRREAESHADEDRRKLAEVEARNTLDSRVYQMEKLIRENREKLAEGDVKAGGSGDREAPRARLPAATSRAIQSATKELESASHKLAEVLYRASAAAGAAGAAGGQGAPGAQRAGGQQSEGSRRARSAAKAK